ncbi:MAG: hypothetical protein ACFFCW_34010 [Candidatus Hodarchaeota archaeon]
MDYRPKCPLEQGGSNIEGSDGTYQSEVRFLLKQLVQLYNLQSEEPLILKVFNTLTRECLSYSVTEKLPQFSFICGDFTPIQFSVSLSRVKREGTALRYVTEISKPFMLLPDRVALGRKRIPLLLELIDATCLQPLIQRVLELLLPQSRLLPDHPMFGFWIGVQHETSLAPSLEIYCNLLWQLDNPWSMSYETLQLLDRIDLLRVVVDIQKSLGYCCQPNFIGLRCNADGFNMIRLYFRGYQLSRSNIHSFLKEMTRTGFENGFELFHKLILGGQETYTPHSVIFSVGSPWEPREFYDIKVEVGPQYYLENDRTIRRRITELARKLKLNVKPYKEMLNLFSNGRLSQRTTRFHDAVGVGFNPQTGTRLNIYLRPDLSHYHKITE